MGQDMQPIDGDLVGQNDQSQKDLEELDKKLHNWMIVSRYVIILVTLAGISFSVLIMHAIRKFPKLHTRLNQYIFHLLLSLVFYYIIRPLFCSLYIVISDTDLMVIDLMRLIWNIEEAALGLVLIFAIAICIDWYAQVYNKESWIRIQNKSYKFIICLLYLLAVFKICLNFSVHFKIVEVFLTFFIISCLIVTVFNFIKCCSSNSVDVDSSLGLRVASVVIYSWTPSIIYLIIFNYFMSDSTRFLEKILMATIFIPQIIISCIPVIIFFILKKKNKDFEAAFAVLLHLKQSYENNQLQVREEQKA